MPEVGDEVEVESVSPDGGMLILQVMALDRHRIDQITMRAAVPASPAGEGGDA